MTQAVATRTEEQVEVLKESVRQFGATVEQEKAKSSFADKIAPFIGLFLSVLLSLVVLKMLSAFLR